MDFALMKLVFERKLTAGDAVDILMLERQLREPWWLPYFRQLVRWFED